jgi:DNA-3-methyladenine glycosylase
MLVEPLPRDFYLPSAKAVAPQLLGHLLLRRSGRDWIGGPIVETEAYLVEDPACHSYGGETARNRVMFGGPGHAYVYFIYGCHFCVNAVCKPTGVAEAVLIRAIEPSIGHDSIMKNRPGSRPGNLTNGPGKLCQALQIGRDQNGRDITSVDSEIVIARNPDLQATLRKAGPVNVSTRVGITRAAHLPLRFYLKNSHFVSRHRGA